MPPPRKGKGKGKFSKDKKDKNNRDTPGDLGEFPYKFVVFPDIAKAAYALNIGEISEPVQTVVGIHLIKVTGRTKGEPSTFEALKETVREVWAQDEDLFESILTQQRNPKMSDIRIMLQ